MDLQKYALKMIVLPSGQVKYYPQQATIEDVAYSIHEALGAQADAALVDGEMNEVSTVVPNGSLVKIIRGENRSVPFDKKLMDMCLPKTKKLMQNQYDERARRETEARGKEKIQKVIMKQGILDLADLYNFEIPCQNLTNMLSELGCKDKLENLYYLIAEDLLPIEKLETNLIDHDLTKKVMGLTTLYVEGQDQSGVLAHVSSIVENIGGNIGLPRLERKTENGKTIFKLRLVIENLKGKKVSELKNAILSDQKDRFDKILVV
jgi:(p)ppGpp synthase/HD superfamily hydrolase